MSDAEGKPNPVITAVSNAVAALRADDGQQELAKAHESLGTQAIETGNGACCLEDELAQTLLAPA